MGVARGIVGELADAAGDQHADVGLCRLQACCSHGVFDCVASSSSEKARRSIIPAERRRRRMWRVVEERPAVIRAQRLVDAFAVEEAVVEDRDDRVALAGDAAVTLTVAAIAGIRAYPLWYDSRASSEHPSLMRILNAAQMREADRYTIEDIGIPSLVLMENAGRQVVAAIEAAHEAQLDGRVAVLCGRGNNGGDGFVVARTLLQRGIERSVFVIGRLADVRGRRAHRTSTSSAGSASPSSRSATSRAGSCTSPRSPSAR